MNAFKTSIELGNGIYTVPDIALILHLSQHKVRRWLAIFYDERLGKKYNGKYSWGEGRSKGTNFLTLIEFYVFYQLREQKISALKILEAHGQMSKELNTNYPFATYQLLVDGKQILYALEEGVWVHADSTNQLVITEVLESFCKKIEFSDENLARRFWPLGKNHNIVVDPNHQFGQPIISGTNINAGNIFSMYESGEEISTISILYDLTEEQVNDAIAFCKSKAA